MRLQATDNVEEYAAAVTSFLEADPCARNVPYTVMQMVQRGGVSFVAPPRFWWLSHGGETVGAAHWTPPYPLLVTAMPAGGWPQLVDSALQHAARISIPLSSVSGPRESAEGVAAVAAARTGTRAAVAKLMLLQQTASVAVVPPAPGARAAARLTDVERLGDWLTAFGEEVDEPIGAAGREQARRMIDAGSLEVWVDAGQPVALCGHRGPNAGVVRIGPVYTPPERRGRGYGRRLVQEVTADALRRDDVNLCMLFADAANPVSNSIYAQIGYRTTAEHLVLRLLPKPS